jgi:error-prone DNA polymerase
VPDSRLVEAGFDPANPEIARLRTLAARLLEFPRHLSQHVGGFVLTQDRLDEMVPIHNGAMPDRTFIEWDKDDIEALGLMKVDVLALGMLTCIRKCFDLMREHDLGDYSLATVPQDDTETYEMLQKGDSIGAFQVESRAQIAMLPRMKPERLYDLVIQVAIVRPGPIQGGMVHPYLRRRNKEEAVEYPGPPENPDELRDVLEKTLGVPLFQEQAMNLAITAARFTPAQADGLRRAMATFRNLGTIGHYQEQLVEGMVERGYPRDFAERCFEQIKGCGSYGFPERHAQAFAWLAYVSSWLKCRYPAAFTCALLNSQPMGFYAPAQLVRDAQEHGVEVRPADVAASEWDNTLEGERVLRLGLRQIDGFREDWAETIEDARKTSAFTSIEEFARRTALPPAALRKLADADAFGSLGAARREALWEVRRAPPDQLPLFAHADAAELGAEPDARLPAMPLSEEVIADYQMTRLSLKAHPMQFLRADFAREGVLTCAEANASKDGRKVRVAGVVLIRQRPGTGNAVFITLEDETGVVNALLWAREMERQRRAVMAARLMVIEGEIQRSKEGVIHLMAARVIDRTAMLDRLSDDRRAEPELCRGDIVANPPQASRHRHPRDVRVLPKSRDFH